MFADLWAVISNVFFLALHVINSGSFPKPLSASEEARYLRKYKEQNDASARDRLIEHNLRLVAHVIKKYHTSSSEQDDLISIGTIGLIKAIETFDCEKGIRLATYASRCIENEVLMYFRNQKKSAQDVFISDPIDNDKDGNTITLMDVIADEANIADDIDTKMRLAALKRIIGTTLSKRERIIIELRYGLGDNEEHTQREIAKRLGISRSYVSRIEKRALEKLRAKL